LTEQLLDIAVADRQDPLHQLRIRRLSKIGENLEQSEQREHNADREENREAQSQLSFSRTDVENKPGHQHQRAELNRRLQAAELMQRRKLAHEQGGAE